MQFNSQSIQWMATKLMGHNHWCSGWLAGLLTADIKLLEHILEQGEGYLHYLCLINMNQQQLSHAELAAIIRSTPEKHLLKSLLAPCPDGLLGTLTRLTPQPMARRHYATVLQLLREQHARIFFSHSSKILPVQLRFLERLPRELRGCQNFRWVKTGGDIKTVQQRIEMVHRLSPRMSYADIARSLRQMPAKDSCTNSWRTFHSWLDKQLQKKHFPEPPWPGNDWIKPIISGPQLRQVGKEMRNCLASSGHCLYHLAVGKEYCYITLREPRLVFSAIKNRHGKWHLLEMAGANNAEPDEKSRADILHALDESGLISTKLWAEDPYHPDFTLMIMGVK